MRPYNIFSKNLKKPYIINLLLLGFSTILSIIGIELIIFYFLDIKPPGYQDKPFFIHSVLTGHSHNPNVEGFWYRYIDGTKFHVSINEYGFADSHRELQKTRPRIALVGDSTTEFWEADEEYRGQYRIEDLLDRKFEVLNFGVRAFGTDQTYILFKNVGIHFSPDIVIYTLCINDFFDNSNMRKKPYFIIDQNYGNQLTLQGYPVVYPKPKGKNEYSLLKKARKYLTKNSFIVRNSVGLLRKWGGWKSEFTPIESHHDLRPLKKLYNEEDSRRMEVTLRLIVLLKDFVVKNGAKFLLIEGVYRPEFSGAMQDDVIKTYGEIFDFNRITRTIKDFSHQQDIEFLSLPKIIKEGNILASDLMHKEDTMHLNRAGIDLYAKSVARKLEILGWVSKRDLQ